jgi:TRAP-type C4-dicarboxylate transport system permease small subunit
MDKTKLEKFTGYCKIFLGILLLIWILLENVVVINRYVFKKGIAWSEEIFVLMFNWFIFIGTALASIDDRHIAITLLADKLKGKAHDILVIVQNVLFAIFIAVVCVQSWKIVGLQMERNQITSILSMPMWFTTIAMALGSVAWLFIVGWRTALIIKGLGKKEVKA